MIASPTMKSTKSLIVLVLLAIYVQNIACKNVGDEKKLTNNDLMKSNPLATRERDLRGLRDVWDQVKNSAISSWKFMIKTAEDTRDKILKWANSARDYAVEIEKSFEEQLEELQKKLDDIIKDLLGTGKLVQDCLKIEGKNIQDALREILKKMSECVSSQNIRTTRISGKAAQFNVNDTIFMTELENKLGACEADKANYEECLYTVRGIVYEQMEEHDNYIQKTNLESRSLADDIMNTLTLCSLQNLADASSFITSEMLQIVRCVLDSKGINEAILE